MKKYVKIGLIVGAVGTVGAVIRSVARKSFDHGFHTGMSVSVNVADGVINEVSEKYNNLVDEYNRLAEDYCDLLDDVDFDVAKIGESEDDSEE